MVRIRSSCWKEARLLPPEARASHSPGALSFLCPSERTILSMRVLPQQCCSKPPFLARLILSPARSDAAMGSGVKTAGYGGGSNNVMPKLSADRVTAQFRHHVV